MARSKYVCVCQFVFKKGHIFKTNIISFSLTFLNQDLSSYQKSKFMTESKMVSLIKSEVHLIIPNLVSFYALAS